MQAHLETQAALQPYVDNAISKTINVSRDFSYEGFKGIYLETTPAASKAEPWSARSTKARPA